MKVGLRPDALEELASPSLLMTAVVNAYFPNIVTRRMPLVEQVLLSLPEHLSSTLVLVGFVLLEL
jgi:hypothetical protein